MKNRKTLIHNRSLNKSCYTNDLIDFLGGENQIKIMNIYAHRIIYCMLEMLKEIQIFKKQSFENQNMDDLVFDEHKGFCTSDELRAYEENRLKNLEKRNVLSIIENDRGFDENFEILEFKIPTKVLKDGGTIKVRSDEVFYEQLQIMSKMGYHIIESRDKKSVTETPFIIQPIWNKGEGCIRFSMSKIVSNILRNTTTGYMNINRKLIFEANNKTVINVQMYLLRKFKQNMGGWIGKEKFIQELSLAERYKKPSNLQIFLDKVKSELVKLGEISFNYKIEKELIKFKLFKISQLEMENKKTTNISKLNSLKYILKVRKLNAEDKKRIENIFNNNTIENLRKVTQKRIDKKILGKDFFAVFISLCIQNNLKLG